MCTIDEIWTRRLKSDSSFMSYLILVGAESWNGIFRTQHKSQSRQGPKFRSNSRDKDQWCRSCWSQANQGSQWRKEKISEAEGVYHGRTSGDWEILCQGLNFHLIRYGKRIFFHSWRPFHLLYHCENKSLRQHLKSFLFHNLFWTTGFGIIHFLSFHFVRK